MKIKTPQPIRGTQDIFGDEALRFNHVLAVFDHVRKLYGFKRAEIPVFESTAVFARSLGETTDVVSKEMYSFEDRSGEPLTLRPEFTAGLCRAYLTSGWQQYAPCKIATHGPVFRYERPQKGRYRQFHQIDAEVLGAAEPEADVELLCLADQLLQELGIKEHVTLHLNTLGDSESREAWRAALVEYFQAHFDQLSDESRERLTRNPLRILDSKDPNDKIIAEKAPIIDDYLTEEAASFFKSVTAGLDAAGVAWTRDPRLVRGLDYYRHTAFEFITDQLGAQGTVLAGGRYDGLSEALGGNLTPAIGWAAGIERLAMLIDLPVEAAMEVAVIPLGDEAKLSALSILSALRHANISAEMTWRGNMKRRMQKANSWGVRYAIILGEEELANKVVTIRSMVTGEQEAIPLDQIVDRLVVELGNK
ncbi:MAG: histidine--tRNA ligase [Zymomonas mobilis subsp. pomaceae]|uniref:Histidine--tRNA ligase n=1 Tax=Zymomonas mobilis subsp. pomaceae (strain ATCC 29192 / DSM 22645 / JCM 10191 / CCUG 17912 / NBRC 13757 / NCIMB 11200 / NRRL B-4491 / Barker I) TaxID=579138 RepID=F8EW68_ZYMMT|nr:histidine--tRNA ligase [Zymomonas mobilis]AEI38478.1 histidyl-tRNA synthetase [Zymomonas mobilis subsp. pomaceae ATCC 29192]MDX5948167.1 histidine--tRNA ligase [Zymomonas mobilis subsp. pomaceae]GEB89893.1 histidine--tRNA ligase [Zymomonas mobilis subsp. pomaceae]